MSETETTRLAHHWVWTSFKKLNRCGSDEVRVIVLHQKWPSWRSIKYLESFFIITPFFDECWMVRIGGRTNKADLPSSVCHPIVLNRKHKLIRLIIEAEHLSLLHARITSTTRSLQHTYCIFKGRSTVHGIVWGCVRCRNVEAKPNMQLLGQLPKVRVNPGSVIETHRVDYAEPITVKCSAVRKPVIGKAYVELFISLSINAVHIEVVSDLTTAAFIATLRWLSLDLANCQRSGVTMELIL